MAVFKQILNRTPVQVAVAWVGAWWIQIVAWTIRWQIRMPDTAARLTEGTEPYIGVFWHGRMMMMHRAWPGKARMHLLISSHRDGLLVSRMMARLGFFTLPGSTKKGGFTALRSMRRLLERGDCIGITPDGPRGPRMRAKLGTIKLAQWSGRPILPATFSTTRRKTLGSWDRFCVARPFSRGVILWGEPLLVPPDADADVLESLRQTLEDRMNGLTDEADRLCRQSPIEPAPPHAPMPLSQDANQLVGYRGQTAADGI